MKRFILSVASISIAAMITLAPATAGSGKIIASGNFNGASNHVTKGGFTVVKTADGGAVVVLDTDFSLDGGPDPHVGFGKDGIYDVATDLGELEKMAGLQIYVVPASVDISDANEIYIWCLDVGVPLGVASLN